MPPDLRPSRFRPHPAPQAAVLWLCALILALFCACGGSSTRAGPAPVAEMPTAPGLLRDLRADPGARDGEVTLRFTAPPGARADAYLVSASSLPIDAETLALADDVAHGQKPGRADAAESLRLTGLPLGRTLHFAVRVRRGAVMHASPPSVSTRVPGRDVPTPARTAVQLSGPTVIDRDGTYVLTADVQSAGTAFRITAAKVVLDLQGHTITYGTGAGTAHGVLAEWLSAQSEVTVRNGRIVQGGGSGSSSHAVFLRGLKDARISYLDVVVQGNDASGLVTATTDGRVRVDHCKVACRTQTVVDRHYPGVAAIYVEDATGAVEVDHNLVSASPQWGIRVQGKTTTGTSLVHHNLVLGTKALVSNAYMIGVYKPGTRVCENRLDSESRGIHIDGVDGHGRDARIHDNDVRFQDQTNEEYPDRHWAHGVKIEGAPGCHVVRNHIAGIADEEHADVYALDVQLGQATGVRIEGNRVSARSVSETLQGRAVMWSEGALAAPNDVVVRHNVFLASDVLVHRDWAGRIGGLFRENHWLRTETPRDEFNFEFFGTSDEIASPGHVFRDPVSALDLQKVGQWAQPAPYGTSRQWTLRVVVRDGAQAVSGARVAVRDAAGGLVFQGDTTADGVLLGVVTSAVLRNGPTITDRKAHTVAVTASGGRAWSGPLDVAGRTALTVDLDAGQATQDTTPPGAPGAVSALALSGSGLWIHWEPAADDTAVVAYLVRLGNEEVGITDATSIRISGLPADTALRPSVRAVDAAGLIGTSSTGAPVRTKAEDRGP